MNNNRRRTAWLVGLGVVLLVAALVALRLFALDRRLTERPARRTGEVVAQDMVSFVAVSVRLRYEALAELLGEQVPKAFEIPGISLPPGSTSRTAVQGSGHVERPEPVAVIGAGEGVRATTRLQASYSLGNALLGSETLQAEANATLAIAVDLDEDWKPVFAIQPEFDWIKPPESRLSRLFNLPLAGLAEDQAKVLAQRLAQQLPDLVEERFNLSALIQQTWDAAHLRVQVTQSPATWLTFQPLGAHFLTPRADADALVLNTGFSANFSVSGDASGKTPSPAPLPRLGKERPAIDNIRIAVPVTMDYQALSEVLAGEVRSQVFTFDAGGRTAEARILDVTVYPSEPQVVLGLHVDVSLPRQWLDTRGWIYLSATPVFDAQAGVLELEDLRVARAVDNRLISMLSATLNDRMVRELERHARLDLAATIEQATRAANERIHAQLQQLLEARLSQGPSRLAERVVVSGGLGAIEAATFTLGEGGITVYPVVSGSLAVELVPLYVRPGAGEVELARQ
ncbi:MAG: hypothetical protein RL030_301 [Pseudomonadota bacterium]|jgi:hypothetical protein